MGYMKVSYQSNWGGGNWFVDGQPFSPKVGTQFKILIDSEEESIATVKERKGEDYDHGHTYAWTNFDLVVSVDTQIGKAKASLLKFLSKNKDCAVYIQEIV
jgi:hypothetical protein